MELKSEKAFRIADLILRYQEETISEEEMEELRLWLKKSTEHQQQFENLNDRDYIRRKRLKIIFCEFQCIHLVKK